MEEKKVEEVNPSAQLSGPGIMDMRGCELSNGGLYLQIYANLVGLGAATLDTLYFSAPLFPCYVEHSRGHFFFLYI